MAQQNYTWPAVSVTATNPSVGTNGVVAPTSSTEVGGIGLDGNLHSFTTDNTGNQNVNVVSSALPTGGATSANQVLQTTQLTGIHTDTSSLDSKTVHVDTGAVVIASSALPTGAATSSLQTSGNASLSSLDGKTVHVDTGAVVIASSALPSGGATSALQSNGNASLASIDSKTPALGQALAAVSVPVVLTASQLSTLTPLSSVTVTQATGTNLHTVVDSSALPSGAATAANQTTGNNSLASLVTNTTGISTAANQSTMLGRLSGSLVPAAYDEIVLTYTGSNITLAEYKLASVLVKTLTLSYTGSNLTSVVAS